MIEYENLNKLNKSFEKGFFSAFEKFIEKGYYILGNEVKEFEKEILRKMDEFISHKHSEEVQFKNEVS